MLLLANVLFGATLSVRFNVVALAWATVGSIVVSICLGIMAGDRWMGFPTLIGLDLIGLEVGFMVGGVAFARMSQSQPSARHPGTKELDLFGPLQHERGLLRERTRARRGRYMRDMTRRLGERARQTRDHGSPR